MKTINRRQGNVTILVVIVIAALAVTVGFFALNYAQIFGAKKEAQTAIDAAALEAAKQLSSAAVPSVLGNIGLVDIPVDSALHPSKIDPNGGLLAQQPVRGVNGLLATMRLDLIIAKQLGNSAIESLVDKDRQALDNSLTALRLQAKGAGARGQQFKARMQAATTQAYISNDQRLNPAARSAPPNIEIQVGFLREGETNIPIPTSLDPESAGNNLNNHYKAGVPYAVSGANQQFTFSATGEEPRLADKALFTLDPPSPGAVPTAVLVKVQAPFQALAPEAGVGEGTKSKPAGAVTAEACAIVGLPRASAVSTVYSIAFVGGLPPAKTFGNTISAKSIMDHPEAFSGFVPGSPTWFSAPTKQDLGGGEPQGVPPNQPISRPFANMTSSNPSDALAFGIYDWLRSNGLRPDPADVVRALSVDLEAMAVRSQPNTTSMAPDAVWRVLQTAYEQPAYAEDDQDDDPSDPSLPSSSCLMQSPETEDLRGLVITTGEPELTQLLANAWSYEPALAVCPSQAAATIFDRDTGNSLTQDGAPVGVLCDFQRNLFFTDLAAVVSRTSANRAKRLLRVLKKQANDDLKDPALAATRGQQSTTFKTNFKALMKRTKAVKLNGHDTHNRVFVLIKKFKAITAKGVEKKPDGTFVYGQKRKKVFTPFPNNDVARTPDPNDNPDQFTEQQLQDFEKLIAGLPLSVDLGPLIPGNVEALRQAIDAINANQGSLSSLSTGNGNRSWMEAGNAITKSVIKSANLVMPAQRTIANNRDRRRYWLMQPASAQPPSSAKAGEFVFFFRLDGDASSDRNQGKVDLKTLNTLAGYPFESNRILPGQFLYMATDALRVAGQKDSRTVWSVIARDQVANLNVDQVQTAQNPTNWCQTGFGFGLQGGSCPTAAGEWRLGCPLPVLDNGCCRIAKRFTYNGADFNDPLSGAPGVDSPVDDDDEADDPLGEISGANEEYCPPIPKQFF